MRGFLIVGMILLVCPAWADGPCKSDREKLCSAVKPGEGRIVQCLKDNADKVSAECKASWKKMEKVQKVREQRKDIRAACEDDKTKLCSNMKKREARQCLRANRDKLSDACKTELKELRQVRKGS